MAAELQKTGPGKIDTLILFNTHSLRIPLANSWGWPDYLKILIRNKKTIC